MAIIGATIQYRDRWMGETQGRVIITMGEGPNELRRVVQYYQRIQRADEEIRRVGILPQITRRTMVIVNSYSFRYCSCVDSNSIN